MVHMKENLKKKKKKTERREWSIVLYDREGRYVR